jgi:D-serine deaminase-like pyridoxal phosphate-dependent protein
MRISDLDTPCLVALERKIPRLGAYCAEHDLKPRAIRKLTASWRWRAGDQVQIIPLHMCPAVNVHDTMSGIGDVSVVVEWAVAGPSSAFQKQ